VVVVDIPISNYLDFQMETEFNRTTMEVISTICSGEGNLSTMDSLNRTFLAEVYTITLVVFKIITMDQDISQTTSVVLRLTIFPPFQPEISSIITIYKAAMNSPMMEGG